MTGTVQTLASGRRDYLSIALPELQISFGRRLRRGVREAILDVGEGTDR